jgi:hypothetical protein
LGTTWKDVGFEVLGAMTMKNAISWDVTACSPIEVYRSFGGKTASIFMVEE